MTDARIPERYLMDRRIVRLTHTQRSSYFMSTLWSVSNRTDGHIEREDLALIPTFDPSSVDALVERGLWAVTETGWVDVDFEIVQTSRDDLVTLDNARKADREKKRRHAAHKRDDHSLCAPDNCNATTNGKPSFTSVPGDVPGELSRGGHRLGEARQGKDKDEVLGAEESGNFAPCCGEEHGPLEPCPLDLFREPETKTAIATAQPDLGYCPPPCGRSILPAGACSKGHQMKERAA